MSRLIHCIYTSVETRPFSSADLAKLVQDSRAKNTDRRITGILLHVRDTFFQVLEGPQDVVDALWSDIVADPRHTRVTRIIYESIPHRYFSDSAMTLATLSPTELAELIEQDNTAVREELLSSLDEGRAKRLLRAFAEGRWRSHLGGAPQNLVRA